MLPLLLPALLLPLPSVAVLSSVLVCLGPLALIYFCCRFLSSSSSPPRLLLYFGLEPQPVRGFGSARASRLCLAYSLCFYVHWLLLAASFSWFSLSALVLFFVVFFLEVRACRLK